MKNIIIITHKLPSWRLPFYKKLTKKNGIKVTIYYSGEENLELDKNYFIHLKHKTILKKFFFQEINTINFSNLDKIILLFDLHFLSNYVVWFRYRKKVKFWGIGLGKNNFLNLLRSFLIMNSDGLISYMSKVHSSIYYRFIDKKKISYMGNTIDNNLNENICSIDSNKISIIGSLDKRKKYCIAFKVVAKLVCKYNYSIHLSVVGDGEEFESLKGLAKNLEIHDKVTFYGRVTEENKIKSILNESMFIVSPGQAGLSVMHSFSYGLPFITYKNCITGGELEHIVNGYNGVIVQDLSVEKFTEEIKRLLDNRKILLELSKNAYAYYSENDMDAMLERFVNAI